MFTGMIIASVNPFTSGSLDKNGKQPVILNVVAGKCPNRNVISGTIAENMGIETGKTYLFNIREGNTDDTYGRQFVFSKLKELDALEIVTAAAQMGASQVFDVAAVTASAKVDADVAFDKRS